MKARIGTRMVSSLVLGLSVGVVVVPATQANRGIVRATDDRVDARVVGIQPAAVDSSDVITRYLQNQRAVVRPTDDRVDARVVGTPRAALSTPTHDNGGSFWHVVGLAVGSALGAGALALGVFAFSLRRRRAVAALAP